jgi:hypothetical protein
MYAMPKARLAGVLLVALAWGQAQTPPPATGKCRVAGQVVHFSAGTPVRKVSVRLKRFSSEPGVSDAPTVANYATTSDDQGRFTFSSVEPGVYWLYAARIGYLEQGYGAREPLLKGSPLRVTAGQDRDSLVIKLTPQSFVYGKVSDEDGDILPNAQVQVYKAAWVQGRKRFVPVGEALSQDDGSFVVGNLQAGRYYLSAAQPQQDEAPPDGAKPRETYGTTYYPGVADPAAASPVDVAAAADVRGLEIRMRLARAFHIRGRAVNAATGAPAPQAYLKLTQQDTQGEPGHMEVGAVAGRDGSFEFRDLAPGSYLITTGSVLFATTLEASLPAQLGAPANPNPPSSRLVGRAVVQVGEQDVDNVVVPLGEGALVTGRVRMQGEEPGRPSPWPGLVLSAADGQGEEPIAAQVKPDGTFRIPRIVPNRYSVQVDGLPDNVYVKSVHFEGRDITGQDLDLASGAGGALEIVLSPDAAGIAGIVRAADGEAAAGATVQVCAGDDTVKYVSSDENGQYKVGGLPPGDYRVLAWEEVDPGLSLDAAFRSHFESQTAAVKLSERAHPTVEVHLIAREAVETEAAKLK